MGKLGEVEFHPQAAFTQDERIVVIAYLREKVRGVRGYLNAEDLWLARTVIVCKDPHGRQVFSKNRYKQVFDFRVTRVGPRSGKEPKLKIKPGAPPSSSSGSSWRSATPSSW